MDIEELIKELRITQETSRIEAKTASQLGKAILESICAFSNEPNIDRGIILLGIEEIEIGEEVQYIVRGVDSPDKIQKEITTSCATIFNRVIRPEFTTQQVEGKKIVAIEVTELPRSAKPLFFIKQGLPKGAYRRISSADVRCTEEDLATLYSDENEYDRTIIHDSSLDDLSDSALKLYRAYRERVNPDAQELTYSDEELLQSLGCIKKDSFGNWKLTVAGLILFGNRKALRRLAPMARVDYISVPTKDWVEDPDNRFETMDIRLSAIELVSHLVNAIMESLPKAFQLSDNEVQAFSKPSLPQKVIREAVVNAIMHRSYKVNSPIQILRYPNRIEIKNAGYSLKPEEEIGNPLSINRNPHIAEVFHETNLAETKGSGFKTMQRLMNQEHMLPPIFESCREKNSFTLRILMHNLLSTNDVEWLSRFIDYPLTDQQKLGLIVLREIGAIDNSTYRQITGLKTNKASNDLKFLCKNNLTISKGKGRGVYYTPSDKFREISNLETNSIPDKNKSIPDKEISIPDKELHKGLPLNLIDELDRLKRRSKPQEIRRMILDICRARPTSAENISRLLLRDSKYLQSQYLKELLEAGELEYTYPDMPRHPKQKYKTKM